MKINFFLIALIVITFFSFPSSACVGGGGVNFKINHEVKKFSGEIKAGNSYEFQINPDMFFRLVPNYTGWDMKVVRSTNSNTNLIYNIYSKVSINNFPLQKPQPFSFATLSFGEDEAAQFALHSISSIEDRNKAYADLIHAYTGTGNFSILDSTKETGQNYSKLTSIKFEGSISYPEILESVSMCAE